MKKEIIYVGDPVCSWCFAFTPVFEKVKEEFKDHVEFSYIMGGLVIDRDIRLDKAMKRLLRKNWKEVTAKTGTPVPGLELLENSKEIPYKSDPACIAFSCVKSVDSEMAYSFYKNLHKAFYEKLTDISLPANLCEIAKESGMDKDIFMTKFNDEQSRANAFEDMEKAKEMGVRAFPALVLTDETGTSVLNQGFKNFTLLKIQIESWLKGRISADNILPVL